MNADGIRWRLAQLASLPYQERYVIGGTAAEYIVDTELLENVDSLKYLVRRPEHAPSLTPGQLAALENLFVYIEGNSGEALAGTSREERARSIRESDVWKTLRAKAASTLELFGISVGNLSVEEINRLSE